MLDAVDRRCFLNWPTRNKRPTFGMAAKRVAIISSRFVLVVGALTFSAHPQAARTVDICELIAKGDQYLGSIQVRTTAMLTWTKEGSFLWGHSCRNRGLPLSLYLTSTLDRDRTWKVLREMGTQNCPAVATFTGSLVKQHVHLFTKEFDSIEFRATSVEGIHRAERTKPCHGL